MERWNATRGAAFFFLFLFVVCDAQIGVNYGRMGNNLPPPNEVVKILKSMGVSMVKIFDANATVISAFSHSKIDLWIMVRNEELANLASNQSTSDAWILSNVAPHLRNIQITTLLVGNEILQVNRSIALWSHLVPAMRHVGDSLAKYNLSHIKVTTALSGDAIIHSHPPSMGQFRPDIAEPFIRPMLEFLSKTHSFLTINPYPYFAYSQDPTAISLNYAIFGSSFVLIQDGKYGYTNILDAMIDARYVAMEKLGFYNVSLAIGETGWPTQGEPTANKGYASLYNQRLINKTLNMTLRGTPRRPNATIPTFIFALFHENLKLSDRERHWGLLKPDGSKDYSFDFAIRSI